MHVFAGLRVLLTGHRGYHNQVCEREVTGGGVGDPADQQGNRVHTHASLAGSGLLVH